MTIVSIVGAGGWGSRVARRLAQFDDVLISGVFDDDHQRACLLAAEVEATALRDFTQHLDVVVPDAVVLAVPAGRRQSYIDAIAHSPRVKKPRVRIEKPLGLTVEEASRAARTCSEAWIDLTVGFTLLHHPLYDAVFQLLDGTACRVTGISALRIGRSAAHDVDPIVDIGVHAASIAAYLDAPADVSAMYHPHAAARETTIYTDAGDFHIDEIALEARTPFGLIRVDADHDALGCDLRAWLDETHRGSAAVALLAQGIVDEHKAVGLEAVA